MAVRYDSDVNYARDKLLGSFIAHGNDLVCVMDIHSAEEVVLRTVDGKMIVTSLKELNLEPPRLGYVNMSDDAFYLSRMPARHYRQGFRTNTTRFRNSRRGIRTAQNPGPQFNLTHRGIYPDIESCMETVINGELKGRAFSRAFSIGTTRKGNPTLEYKGKTVGKVNDQNGEVHLDNKFLFLQEVFQKCL